MAKKKYLDNLIVLKFAPNTCYQQVITARKAFEEYPKDFSIDLENKTWNWRNGRNMQIGKARFVRSYSEEGIIGIYDRNLTEHLDSMIHSLGEIIRESSRGSINID